MKKKVTKAVKVNVKKVFNYMSVCCKEPATKPALVRTEEADGHLGHWRCTKCHRNCKVTRSKVKDNIEVTDDGN